jgi:hypothetical protein
LASRSVIEDRLPQGLGFFRTILLYVCLMSNLILFSNHHQKRYQIQILN